jgi:class 3 adenylate cyclase
VSSELLRLLWAFVIGLGVLVGGLFLAWLIARSIARPLGDLAVAAERVRDLDIENLGLLRGSRIREFDETAEAFNAMVGGLRWFEHYVPRKLVQRLIQGGEDYARHTLKRELTVMFTDIADFTAQSETMSAEDVRSFLNEHFALLAACIEEEGGTIDKYIGDAIMAFWGAPKKMEDHAQRACRAAVAIRDAVEADNRRRTAAGGLPVRMRIGIHTGDVIVGNIGAPDRVNYTIVGDAVNTANRLEALGKELQAPGEEVCILASADTAARAGAGFEFESTGTHVLRGRAQGVEILHLRGRRDDAG